MRHPRTLGRLLAAAALVAAAAGAGVPAPAAAAGCSSAAGVTVVVDFNELGGGVPSVCDADGGGKKAAVLFGDAGFPLTYAQRQPGFVCRVSGVPTSDPCVNTAPANAYWGLWWSDGTTGTWSYSSLGAPSLTIPEGGYVAFSWDQGEGSAAPSFTPAVHRAEPTQTPTPTSGPTQPSSPSPTSKPTRTPSPGPGTGTSTAPAPGGTPSASQSATPTDGSSPSPSGSDGASPSATATQSSASPTAGAAATDVPTDGTSPDPEQYVAPGAAEPAGDGLPAFVAPALIGTLFGVAGVVYLFRRRPGSP